MRRLRRGKAKRQKELLILVTLVLFSVLTVGYAAFQTNITLTSKGNVKKYKVTFDPNGGVLDKESKYVGKVYGDLPTPTREGYNFLGWHGKNLFNPSTQIWLSNTTISDGTITQISADTRETLQWKIQTYNNDTFLTTLSLINRNILGPINFTFTKNSTFNRIRFGLNGAAKDTVATYPVNNLIDDTTYSLSFNILNVTQGSVSWNDIQLEEGTEATEWEPYYITSETEVVQKQDHTLTAIWEEIPEEQIQ